MRKEQFNVEVRHKEAKYLHEYNLLIATSEDVRRFGRVPDYQRKGGTDPEEWQA